MSMYTLNPFHIYYSKSLRSQYNRVFVAVVGFSIQCEYCNYKLKTVTMLFYKASTIENSKKINIQRNNNVKTHCCW